MLHRRRFRAPEVVYVEQLLSQTTQKLTEAALMSTRRAYRKLKAELISEMASGDATRPGYTNI
jgi:hypothetical protein